MFLGPAVQVPARTQSSAQPSPAPGPAPSPAPQPRRCAGLPAGIAAGGFCVSVGGRGQGREGGRLAEWPPERNCHQ